MIRRLLPFLAATLFAGAASAADIAIPGQAPSSAPGYAASRLSQMDWSGFTIGLQAGYANSQIGEGLWNNNRYAAFGRGLPSTIEADGWTGGLRGSYDVQFGNGLVLGAILEGNLSDLEKGARNSFLGFPFGAKTRIANYGILSGRVGYAYNDLLFYGTAGAGLASVDVRVDDALFRTNYKTTSSLGGFSLGGGIDYAINPNLVVGVGYRYLDLGSKTVFQGTGSDSRIGGEIHTVQGMIGFKY